MSVELFVHIYMPLLLFLKISGIFRACRHVFVQCITCVTKMYGLYSFADTPPLATGELRDARLGRGRVYLLSRTDNCLRCCAHVRSPRPLPLESYTQGRSVVLGVCLRHLFKILYRDSDLLKCCRFHVLVHGVTKLFEVLYACAEPPP